MDPQLGVIPTGDILVENGVIASVGPSLARRRRGGAEVIDASGMYVTPGFVDTHRHVWHKGMANLASDLAFPEYLGMMDRLSERFLPADLYLAALVGGIEAVYEGTTTLLDWCHNTLSREHVDADIQGLGDSGVRAVFAYGPPHVDWFDSEGRPSEQDVRDTHAQWFADPSLHPLLSMSLAIRGPEFSTPARWHSDIDLARDLGVPITMHAGIAPFFETANSVVLLDEAGLLGDDLTFVHANAMEETDFARIAETGGHVSFSPEVEQQMFATHAPLTRAKNGGVTPCVSVDVTSAVGGGLPTQARFLLQTQRMLDASFPLAHLAREGMAWMTTAPARAVGMEDRIGSLTPGKQADVNLIRKTDPNLLSTLEPEAAVVLSLHAGNVDTVLVAGRPVKRAGQLVDVDLPRLRREMVLFQRRLLEGVIS